MRSRLVHGAIGILVGCSLGTCTTVTPSEQDPFTDLRATIRRETAERPDLQASLLRSLDGGLEAFRRGDPVEGDHLLAELGDRVWNARGEGLSDESAIRIFESGTVSAERIIARRWQEHYWTRIEKFPGRRCIQGSCRTPDPNWDCYMVSVCGEHKGCIARRK